MLILRRQNQRFETLTRRFHGSTDASLEKKTTSTAHPIVRAQVNRKGVYMTSFKVICDFAFMLPPDQRFALTNRKRTFLGVLKRRLFENKHGRNITTFENAVAQA